MVSTRGEVDLLGFLRETREDVNEEITRLFGSGLEQHRVLYDLILDYPLRGGKALRPGLAIAMTRALGGYREAILPTAATLELYHNAFLIHDDVEDESLMRRGAPTLHTAHGTPVAVNVGDAMLVLSLQPLLDNTSVVGLGPALKILSLVARMTRESVEGQAIELAWVRDNAWDLSDRDYCDMVVQKTGWYSFIAPMQAGAIVAGATPAQLDSIESFGRELSVAFQIQDDVLNVVAEPEPYGKEIGGDLWEGKRTVILLHALRCASRDENERAKEILARARPTPTRESLEETVDQLLALGLMSDEAHAILLATSAAEKTQADVDWLYELIRAHDSIGYASRLARHHAERARELLADMTWIPRSSHRAIIEELVEYVYERDR